MLICSILIFIAGILTIYCYKRNYLFLIISLEIFLLSINYLLIVFSKINENNLGNLFVLYILIIAAVETVIGLTILILYYRETNTVEEKIIE